MKRILFILLIIVSLAGCAEKPQPKPPEGWTGDTQEFREPVMTATPQDLTPRQEQQDTGFRTEIEPSYTPGSVGDGAYESEYFGIGFTPGEGWSFYSEAELDALSVEEDAAFDLYAWNGLCSVNITVEKADDPEKYVDDTLAALPETLGEVGYSDVKAEKLVELFAGKGRWGVKMSAEAPVGGETARVYQRQYAVQGGGYLALVTVSSFVTDETDDIAAAFYQMSNE